MTTKHFDGVLVYLNFQNSTGKLDVKSSVPFYARFGIFDYYKTKQI